MDKAASAFQAGAIHVTCLTDGATRFDANVFPQVGDDLRAELLGRAGLDGIDTQFNAYVLRLPDGSVTLVDTGCGRCFGPAGGQFATKLAALGIAPADVSRIIFTHLHRDHCGGAVIADSTGDRLAFPAAQVVLHKAEATHWQGQDVLAGRLLDLAPAITTVADGADLGFGITAWALPGHTPGHMGLRLDGLVLVGDVIHSEALQLPRPDLGPIYDEDSHLAFVNRMKALEMVADQDLVWSGSHMLGPEKFARLTREGNGFARKPLGQRPL